MASSWTKFASGAKRRGGKKGITWVSVAVCVIAVVGYLLSGTELPELPDGFDYGEVPEYSGAPAVELNDNVPFFAQSEVVDTAYEDYAPLDSLGRCGSAMACIGTELMPTEERGDIGMIKPSGWHTVRYDDLIKDKYLYNRCHLIAFMLAGENANERNLTTGTRYLNVEGMLPYEEEVCDYVKETGNHVMYRVSPVFVGKELVARGVLMEAYSVEDSGRGVRFCVFAYNVQPGVVIDYATGESWRAES